MLYKVIEQRYAKRSTAMAFLGRLVDGATELKLRDRSYCAARARTVTGDQEKRLAKHVKVIGSCTSAARS